jgi:hypothetical protein
MEFYSIDLLFVLFCAGIYDRDLRDNAARQTLEEILNEVIPVAKTTSMYTNTKYEHFVIYKHYSAGTLLTRCPVTES